LATKRQIYLVATIAVISCHQHELSRAILAQGFITFDSSIHFYNLKSSLASPQMHVVSDVSDVILPVPEDLLVNLQVNG
jgi:hypothetical protein